MSCRKVFLSPAAENDLADILLYTRQTWGDRQVNVYHAKLNAAFRTLQVSPLLGRSRDNLCQGCRILTVAQHEVIYRLQDDDIEIVRILSRRVLLSKHF